MVRDVVLIYVLVVTKLIYDRDLMRVRDTGACVIQLARKLYCHAMAPVSFREALFTTSA
jgi:hypothetical protein